MSHLLYWLGWLPVLGFCYLCLLLIPEFTNPYGVRTSRPASRTSSDGLTQFGTARDYPDFDMQNDLFWYKEKDEDFTMLPVLTDGGFYGDLSEDKFVTAVQKGERVEDLVVYNFISDESITNVESQWTRNSLKDEPYKDYYELGDHFRQEQGDDANDYCFEYSCSAPLSMLTATMDDFVQEF